MIMRLQRIKVLTGTALSLALSLVAVSPAMAIQGVDEAVREIGSVTGPQTVVGTVKSLTGEVVTLELPNGRTEEIGLNRMEQGALGLVPGMRVVVTLDEGDRVAKLAPMVDTVAIASTAVRVQTTQVERTPPRVRVEPRVEPAPEPVRQPVQPAPEPISEPIQERPVRALW